MTGKTTDLEWSIWVFAGPGALRGLDQHEREAELLDGEDATVAAALERVFGQAGALPAQLTVCAEQVTTPTLLDILTNQWRGRRSRWRAGEPLSTAAISDGPRELAQFLAWAAAEQPKAKRRALVVLGDVLRARQYFDTGRASLEIAGRPDDTRPQTVKIKTGEETDHEYALELQSETTTDPVTGATQTTTTSLHYQCKQCRTTTILSLDTVDKMLTAGTAVAVDDTSSAATQGDARGSDGGASSRLPHALERDSRPKPTLAGGASPEPVSRAVRRVAGLIDTLTNARLRFDLLVTDSCEPTVFEQLQRLAPCFETIVSAQVEAPISGWPLADLFAVLHAQLDSDPDRLEAERIATNMVGSWKLQQQRSRLWRGCQKIHERQGQARPSPATPLARRLLRAGHDAVALRTAGVAELGRHIDTLGETLGRLVDDGDLSTHIELRRCIEWANYRYDDFSERCDLAELLSLLLDSEGGLPGLWRRELAEPAEAIRRGIEAGRVVLAQAHQPGRGPDRGPLSGLSLHLPVRFDELGSEPAGPVNGRWRAVLEALHYVDPALERVDAEQRARVASERRMHQDMAAFRQSTRSPSATEVCEDSQPRRAWAMLHYLPGDNPGGASTVGTMAALATYARSSEQLSVAALLDRPPPEQPDRVGEPRTVTWTIADRSLTNTPIPPALARDSDLVASWGWARGDSDAGILALSLTGEVWDLPPDAKRLADGELLHRLAEPATLVTKVVAQDRKNPMAIELRLTFERPHHAAQLLPGDTQTRSQGQGAWHGHANVEQLGAINSGTGDQLREFVEQAVGASSARHLGLVITGRADFGGGFSLCHDTFETSFLTIPDIASSLRAALRAVGRDRLSLLILEDPNMMSLEVAYELRDLAHVLLAPTDAATGLDCVALLRDLEALLSADPWGLEARAYRGLTITSEPYAEIAARWRHAVARLAAEELIDASRYPAQPLHPATALDQAALDQAIAYNNGPHCRRPSCTSPRLDRASVELIQEVVGVPVDGVIGEVTTRALFVWQGRFGLTQTGKVDDECLARIHEVVGEPPKPAELELSNDDLDAAATHNEGRRDDRRFVEKIQAVVGAPADGLFGPITTHALFAWQRWAGLEQNGKLDDPTIAKIKQAIGEPPPLAELPDPAKLPHPPNIPGPIDAVFDETALARALAYNRARGLRPEEIETVQTIVRAPIDGEISPITTHAVLVWQELVGLTPSGKLDDPTLGLIEDFDVAIDYNLSLNIAPATIEGVQRVIGARVDGIIGPCTVLALYVWQARVGLTRSGILDSESLKMAEAHGARIPRLQAIDLQLVDRLGRRLDAVCRAALRELGESAVWESVRFTELRAPPRQSLRSLLADMKAGPAVTRVLDVLDPHARGEDQGGLWIGKLPARSYGRLLVYTKADVSADYLNLDVHQHVRLYALLSAYRLLSEHGKHPHRLWGLVSAGLAFTPRAVRDGLLSRLIGQPVDSGLTSLQFASMGSAPLITMALEDDDGEADRYELRLTSSESTALLLRQQSRVNPEGIEHALAGLDFLLSGRQTTRTTWPYLESLGSSLGEDIINHLHDRLELERQQLLAVSHAQDAHLALAIPRKLMRYPWELMLVPTDANLRRKQMLCERFAVGRQVWSDRGRRASTTDGRDTKIKALIIGDPKTRGAAELPGARAEAHAVADIFMDIDDELGDEMDFDPERDVFIHTTVTRAAIRRLLRDGDYDIVHFAGHAKFSAEQPERSAWLLSDGPLWASELRNTLAWCPNPPWMIFANACHAAMTSDREPGRYQGEVYGLAEACIQEGVSAYVAPLWQVSDEPARLLATTLYRSLLLGRSTIGAALRRARVATRRMCEARRRQGENADISWASMVLYGNPTDRLFAALGTELPTS